MSKMDKNQAALKFISSSDATTEKKAINSDKLIQKAYYITEKQYKALKMHVILSDEKDMSAVVRNALDLYLSETMEIMDRR